MSVERTPLHRRQGNPKADTHSDQPVAETEKLVK